MSCGSDSDADDHVRHHPAHVCAFVLGLPGEFRGSSLLRQLADAGITATRIDALDGRALSPDQLEQIYDRAAAGWIERELTPAEAACAFGHLTMLRQFLETGDEWALFFEDDALLLRDPRPLIELLPLDLRVPPTVVHLQADAPNSGDAIRLATGGQTTIWATDAPPLRTVAYAVNRALARVAVEAYREHRIDSVADWPIRWRHDVQFAVCDPPVVGHADVDSTIEHDRVFAQEAGARDRRTRMVAILDCLCGHRVVRGRQMGYPGALVLRLHLLEPIATPIRHRWNHVRADRRLA